MTGLAEPTSFAYAPDGRIYFSEKAGVVKVWHAGKAKVFLDLRSRVNSIGERGLVSLALDPHFNANRRLYLFFTEELHPENPDKETPAGGVLVRLEVSRDDPDRPEAGTEKVLVTGFDSHGPWHSVAGMDFDSQGRLLAGFGDGMTYFPKDFGREAVVAQDLDELNGKIVRIDPETGRGVPDNPYFDPARPTSPRSRILARGFREPFRVRFDSLGNRVYVGDVGTHYWEEIDEIPAAVSKPDRELNFGWPCYEGGNGKLAPLPELEDEPVCKALAEADGGGAAAPAYAYSYPDARAVVVGPVYHGGPYPDGYDGRLFFGDFTRGALWTFDGSRTADFGRSGDWESPVDLRTTPSGTLAYLSLTRGELREIRYEAPSQTHTASAIAIPVGGLGMLALAIGFWTLQVRRTRRRPAAGVLAATQKGALVDDLDLPGGHSTPDEIGLARALVNLERRRDFRVHLFVYIAWSLFLGVVWIVTEHERTGTWPRPFSDNPQANWSPWIAYAVFGWGLIVAFHAFVTYRRPVTPHDLQEELRRLRGEA